MIDILSENKIIAVLRANSFEEAEEKAFAIFEGGIKIIEVTFTVPNADILINKLSNSLKEAIIGAGTVITVRDCEKAIKNGAKFIVSPHIDEILSKFCIKKSIPYFPGVMTPTEVVQAKKLGHSILKLFPGNFLKPNYIKTLKGPFPDLNFIPTGGVSLENIETWFENGAFAVGVGSNLTKGTPQEVFEKTKKFVEKLRRD